MSYREDTWTAPASRRQFSYRLWRPGNPRALLVLVHGFGEHGGRYGPVAETLAAQDLTVAVPDLWGHGRSGGRRGDLGDVGRCVEELAAMIAQVFRPEAGGLECALFGHSFGGLVAIRLALEIPAVLRRLIIQSPLLAPGFPVPRWKTAAARLLCRVWPSCSFSTGLDAGLLSHDPAAVEAYRRDPLVHHRISARTYCTMLRTRGEVMEQAPALQVPTLLLYGTDDRIVSIDMATQWFNLLTCEKRAVAFPGASHELHHEPIREEALRLVGDWALGAREA